MCDVLNYQKMVKNVRHVDGEMETFAVKYSNNTLRAKRRAYECVCARARMECVGARIYAMFARTHPTDFPHLRVCLARFYQ